MNYLRTPDTAFENIGFDYEPHYVNVIAEDTTELRMHYIDEGAKSSELILCIHGQPSWSYLYRDMVAPLVTAGFRVIALDLIGFGKSDKPTSIDDYSYGRHVKWVLQFIESLELYDINGLFQDWGGMIGMRVVELDKHRFKRVIVANTMLLDTSDISDEVSRALQQTYDNLPLTTAEDVRRSFAKDHPMAAVYWVKYATENPDFAVSDVFRVITGKQNKAVLRGYASPFPDKSYLAGPLAFPRGC